jgi:hypothetical protein
MRGSLFGVTFRFSVRWDGGFIGAGWVRETYQLNWPGVFCTDHALTKYGLARGPR